jgi:hypothetical protein
MKKPPLDADVADTAPSDSVLTVHDEDIEIIGDPSRKARTKHNQWVAVTNSAIGNQRPQRASEGSD